MRMGRYVGKSLLDLKGAGDPRYMSIFTVSNVVAQGYVFTAVCDSVHRGGGVCLGMGVCVADTPNPQADTPCPVHAGIYTPSVQCMLGYTPLSQCMLGYTHPSCPVHGGIHTLLLPSACWDTPAPRQPLQWTVRIVLECILVSCNFGTAAQIIAWCFLSSKHGKVRFKRSTRHPGSWVSITPRAK